jgi:hypothetical protein
MPLRGDSSWVLLAICTEIVNMSSLTLLQSEVSCSNLYSFYVVYYLIPSTLYLVDYGLQESTETVLSI